MNQEFLKYLPSEIIINILSRLPIRTIISCKSVCRLWLNLLNTTEFAKAHLSQSVQGLAVCRSEISGEWFDIFELEDKLDLEHHELHYNPVTTFDGRRFISNQDKPIVLVGSANGLFLLRSIDPHPNTLYICNPITREYIRFPSPEPIRHHYPAVVTYGFGVSRMTDHPKVVRIFHHGASRTLTLITVPEAECQVYTLGTGSWRSIRPGAPLDYNCHSVGAFLNGNLHWLVADSKNSHMISCLDLETELFTTFSPPPLPQRERFLGGLVALEGCLCICDNTSDNEIVIWMMKKYGVEKSWTKEFKISKSPDFSGESYEVVYPQKIFRDGDILMCWDDFHLFYYSNKTKTTHRIDMFELRTPGKIEGVLHTLSFLSLKRFAMENVASF